MLKVILDTDVIIGITLSICSIPEISSMVFELNLSGEPLDTVTSICFISERLAICDTTKPSKPYPADSRRMIAPKPIAIPPIVTIVLFFFIERFFIARHTKSEFFTSESSEESKSLSATLYTFS